MTRPKWLLRTPAEDARARLFCFPYSGTGASMYRRWPRRIGATEVCPLQPPGRENRIREPHYGTFQELAADLADVLRPYLDRPFAFIGHCSGALPGVETALRLARNGWPTPARVFVSSQVAPQDGPYGRFIWLSSEELRHELGILAARMGATPDPSLLELGLDAMRRDVDANGKYHYPEPPQLPVPITAIGWSADREVPPDLMNGWRLCADDVRYVLLDGEHYDYLSAPQKLLAEIGRDMDLAIAAGVAADTAG